MNPIYSFNLVAASLLIAFAANCADVPLGWFAPAAIKDYRAEVDTKISRSGKASATIRSIAVNPKNFGNLMQTFAADDYRGKRVRLTGYVKTLDAASAQFWMRVDGRSDKSIAFDNMDNRPIKGTADWTKCELVLDVAEEAKTINLGCMLIGTGKLWFDDLMFEVVGKDVPVTDMLLRKRKGEEIPPRPVNLGFEEDL